MAKHFVVELELAGSPRYIVKAKGAASARKHVADKFVIVNEATSDDLIKAGRDGTIIEDATTEPAAQAA